MVALNELPNIYENKSENSVILSAPSRRDRQTITVAQNFENALLSEINEFSNGVVEDTNR